MDEFGLFAAIASSRLLSFAVLIGKVRLVGDLLHSDSSGCQFRSVASFSQEPDPRTEAPVLFMVMVAAGQHQNLDRGSQYNIHADDYCM